MKTLTAVYKEYEATMRADLSAQERDVRLASLMTRFEREFHVPLLTSKEWECEHSTLIALYRRISESRVTV